MNGAWAGAGGRLNVLLGGAGLEPLDDKTIEQFQSYLSLILRWNARMNLTAVRGEEGILSRHFVESIACAWVLPAGVRTLLDFGSGAGLPGIPIAICRPEIIVTLAESQSKRAAFLQEAVRSLSLSAQVYAGRAESLQSNFDCVVLRAVDRMADMVRLAARLVSPEGWLGLMTTSGEFDKLQAAAGAQFRWLDPVRLPGSAERIIALAKR